MATATRVTSTVDPVPLRYLLTEQQRLVAEAAFFSTASGCVTAAADPPRTVLLIPGLLATDRSIHAFGREVRRLGHDVQLAGLPRYLDWNAELADRLERRLEDACDRAGGPVTVVGWSAGGILGRELARTHAEHIEQVITVASPFRYRPGDPSVVAAVMRRLRPHAPPSVLDALPPEDARPPLVQPVTSIYSHTDGIAGWQLCRVSPGARAENIAVRGSHSGMSRNVAVLLAVADRLARPVQAWRPFRAVGPARVLFPGLSAAA